LKCNLHGSRFTFDGKVTQGPAKTDLKSYPATVKGNVIAVNVG
jgi:Rieske Fe-S protein